MNVRAVWTGLAALFAVSLGSALASFSDAPASWGRWLLACVYAAAVAIVQMLSWEKLGSSGAGRRRWMVPVNLGSGITALAGLGLLWYLEGAWLGFVVGGPVMLALTVTATIHEPTVRLPIDLFLLALALPLVGFTAGGANLALYPWTTSAALTVPSLAFLFAIHPEALANPDPQHHERTDRLMTLSLALVGFGGVLIVGRFSPGSPELRLLGISPAMVVAFTALAALLHPSAEGGRRLAEILVPASYLSMIAGITLIYAIV